MQSSGAVNMRQQLLKEFEVAFAVEDDDGDVMTILGWTDEASNVLSDDVLEQRGPQSEANGSGECWQRRPVSSQ